MDKRLPLRLIAWMALVLAAVFFLTTGGTYPGIASVEGHVIGQVIAIAVLGGWLALALVRPEWRPRTPLLVPIALASAAYLASAIASQRPRLSFEPTIAGLGWALAFLFLSRLLVSDWFRARVAVVMTAFLSVIAFGYIVQVAVEWVNWWGLVGRLVVPPLRPSFAGLFLGSPNLIATALLLLAPLVVAIAWTRYRRHSIAIAIAIASAVAILLAASRGAWLGCGVGFIVAVALAATRRGARLSPSTIVAAIRSRPIVLLPILALGAIALLFAPSLVQRFAQGGTTIRIDLWRSALTIFGEHPILGAGPGTWVQLKVAANPEGIQNVIFPHAHDMYVQAAAELGIVGLGAGIILVLAVSRRLWTAWRSDHTALDTSLSSLSIQSGAVLVSLAAFAAQSVVDNLSNLPFVCLLVVTLVAWVDGGRAAAVEDRVPIEKPAGRRLVTLDATAVLPALGLAAIAILVPTLLRVDRAAALVADANVNALRGSWELALDGYDAARQLDPGFTLYELQTASGLARVGRIVEARDVLAHAIDSDPVAINVIGLAALEAELGDREGALAHVRQAVALGVREPVVALNAGLIAERLREPELALNQFALAIASDPALAGSGIWASPSRSTSRVAIVAAARALVDAEEGALILAYAGEPTEARDELDALPASDRRAVYTAVTYWLGRDTATARTILTGILTADPGDWFAAAWASRIERIGGDVVAAERFARWARAVQGDTAPGVIVDLSVVPARDGVAANLPGFYPWAVYLRPIAPYLMIASLTLIGSR